MQYTVIGAYIGTYTVEATYVAWVDANTPEEAVARAKEIDASRNEACTIAVLRGHHTDTFDLATSVRLTAATS